MIPLEQSKKQQLNAGKCYLYKMTKADSRKPGDSILTIE